jgi:amino acid transporter
VALIAVANGALLAMIMASRLVFGMAEQGLLSRPLATVLPERRTPWVAIVVTTIVAIGLTLTGDLGDLGASPTPSSSSCCSSSSARTPPSSCGRTRSRPTTSGSGP